MFIVFQKEANSNEADFVLFFDKQGDAINEVAKRFEEDGEVYHWSPVSFNNADEFIQKSSDLDEYNGVKRGDDYPALMGW